MIVSADHELSILELVSYPIADQLELELSLLNHDSRNFCLINVGTPPTVVMGISGKADLLIHLDQLSPSIPIIRRHSGGGTVIVDEETLFLSFICNKNFHPFLPYPEPILRWVESLLAPVTPGLKLIENDFVIGEKKCGGNALYIRKDRWLVHTSFLWDYDSSKMELLKLPPKMPTYRAGRKHEKFICKLSELISSKKEWLSSIKNELSQRYKMGKINLF